MSQNFLLAKRPVSETSKTGSVNNTCSKLNETREKKRDEKASAKTNGKFIINLSQIDDSRSAKTELV